MYGCNVTTGTELVVLRIISLLANEGVKISIGTSQSQFLTTWLAYVPYPLQDGVALGPSSFTGAKEKDGILPGLVCVLVGHYFSC